MHNLGASGSGGTEQGPPGVAATLELGSWAEIPYGQPMEITMTGTSTNRLLNLRIPGPAPAPTGGMGGASFPPGGSLGQSLVITNVAADGTRSYGWATSTGGAGGGTVDTAEQNIDADANGVLTMNATIGMHFRHVLSRNIEVADPVGYTGAQSPTLVLVQPDSGGPFTVTRYGRNIMPEDRQPFVLATEAKAVNFLEFRRTGNNTFIMRGSPNKSITAGYGLITALARIGTTEFYSMADAVNAIQNNQTIYITRNGKGSESTFTLAKAGTYNICGQALPDGSRPTLETLKLETRLSFQKAIANFENFNGQMQVVLRDFRVKGARNPDGTSRGIAPNGGVNIDMHNIHLEDNENGMLWTGDPRIRIYNSHFHRNGQLGEDGKTHNIYAGEGATVWEAHNTSFTSSARGHNIKSRGYCLLRGVYTEGASEAREMDVPNGGGVDAEDCWFNKFFGSASQNDLIGIGQEGVITTRTRYYNYKHCRFTNPIDGAGRDATFINNRDTTKVTLTNPLFEGSVALSNNSTVDGFPATQGLRGNVEVIYEAGATLGPRYTPGRPATVAMTPPVN